MQFLLQYSRKTITYIVVLQWVLSSYYSNSIGVWVETLLPLKQRLDGVVSSIKILARI